LSVQILLYDIWIDFNVPRLIHFVRTRTFVSTPAEKRNKHGFVVHIGKSQDQRSLGLNITSALRTYFDHNPEMPTETKICTIANFVRGIGFFKSCGVSFRILDWTHSELVTSVSTIGSFLPPQQFLIYMSLPTYEQDSVVVQLQVRGMLKRLRGHVARRIERAKTGITYATLSMGSLLDLYDDSEQLDADEYADEKVQPLESGQHDTSKNVVKLLIKYLDEQVSRDTQVGPFNFRYPYHTPLFCSATDFAEL
jgi:hypothetical protein